MNINGSAAIFPTIAQALQAQAPEEFAAWVNAHPDHPQRDLMLEGATRYLIQSGKTEEARGLADSVVNPQVRARLEASVRQFEAAHRNELQAK